MSRLGHKYERCENGRARRAGIDRTPEEFAETMNYRNAGVLESRERFLSERCSAAWIRELNGIFQTRLAPNRRALFIGSGLGEHEVPLAIRGFNVVASDIFPEGLEETRRLFPELQIRRLDILNPPAEARGAFDDVVDGGLTFYYDDAAVVAVLKAMKGTVRSGGRVFVVHRYNDTALTWWIDRWVLPLEAFLKNTVQWARRSPARFVRKTHGFRRSVSEMTALAAAAGLRARGVFFAGHGWELNRSALLSRLRFPIPLAGTVDRWLHQLQAVTVFEFTPEEGAA